MDATSKPAVMDRYRESYRLYELAHGLIPGGVTKARVPFVPGRYPVYATRARGARCWDVDGNEYIDWMCGYGAILLGYQWAEVDQAVVAQMSEGFGTLLSNPRQNELAERLIGLIPCAETVRLLKTGTDATTAAVRTARIFTGRDKIVRFGYHGWADWSLANFEGFDAGVPQAVRELTLSLQYNDLESVRRLFADNPAEIAGVIMMPFETEAPAPGFLEGVRDLCHENGAVFILDEIRSGFRMAPGGAQEYLGVTPDLATFSKAMGNGYAISALVGRREIMGDGTRGLFSATFFTNPLEMAAALAVLDILEREPVIEHLWRLGGLLQDGLRELAARSGLPLEVTGYPPMPFLQFRLEEAERNQLATQEFFAQACARGVYLHPGHHWFVSYAHTEADVHATLEACAAALKETEAVVG